MNNPLDDLPLEGLINKLHELLDMLELVAHAETDKKPLHVIQEESLKLAKLGYSLQDQVVDICLAIKEVRNAIK